MTMQSSALISSGGSCPCRPASCTSTLDRMVVAAVIVAACQRGDSPALNDARPDLFIRTHASSDMRH